MPSSYKIRKLINPFVGDAFNPASVPELPAIRQVLARAFSGAAFVAVATGHDPDDPDTSYVGPFYEASVIAALVGGGEVYIAETDETEREIVGCAVWFGPGHSIYDSPAQVCIVAVHGKIERRAARVVAARVSSSFPSSGSSSRTTSVMEPSTTPGTCRPSASIQLTGVKVSRRL
ncbi:unnamed protein product [Mycena citricolor]|uniref:Uncharacterized protein n=1 Tax=Mycena citricolor TaxID=2018698 RepID=A0AAD2HER3_9AGAR|nr:unnamed protein product [Mycena citricolor]